MIKKAIELITQSVLIIGGGWYGIYFSNISNLAHHKEEQGNLGRHTEMNHGFIDVTNDSIVPEIERLEVVKDPMSGWNLYLKTKKIVFKPQNAGKKHQQGEGHAHLKINGKKIARLYSNYFHIPTLEMGSNNIEVTINANSHEIMSINNRQISTKVFIFNIETEYCWNKLNVSTISN